MEPSQGLNGLIQKFRMSLKLFTAQQNEKEGTERIMINNQRLSLVLQFNPKVIHDGTVCRREFRASVV